MLDSGAASRMKRVAQFVRREPSLQSLVALASCANSLSRVPAQIFGRTTVRRYREWPSSAFFLIFGFSCVGLMCEVFDYESFALACCSGFAVAILCGV